MSLMEDFSVAFLFDTPSLQVALMYQASECHFEVMEPWASRAHSKLSERLDMVHSSLTDRLVAEVKRCNRLLKPLQIWE